MGPSTLWSINDLAGRALASGLLLALVLPGCAQNDTGSGLSAGDPPGGDDSAGTEETEGGTGPGGDGDGDEGDDGNDEGVPKLDVDPEDDDSGGDGPGCKVDPDEMDAAPPCEDVAPPNSFEPEVQWAWEGENGEGQVVVTPLVANLTDDNEDGEIDLCDTPDIIVTAYESGVWAGDIATGHIYVLDGETGAVHFQIPQLVANRSTPAIGDIDADGLPEIVTVELEILDEYPFYRGRLIAFNHDGTLSWKSPDQFKTWCSPALADVDNDGDVEILCKSLYDHEGNALLDDGEYYGSVLADLDGDDDLEIIGGNAHHHDGTLYYESALWGIQDVAVANFDDDDDPEILAQYITSGGGVSILEHDGTVKIADKNLIGNVRPAAIHDVDGDGQPDLLLASANAFSVFSTDFTLQWTQPVSETSGFAGSTAFDFLGDASAEAIYADEFTLYAWDGADGTERMTSPRSSWTYNEYPVVADVDNDNSAEIVVASNERTEGQQTSPAVQVIRDAEDRWIPARRIWNQHTYHVTNVSEDGTIPQFEPPHWKHLNTFRTQAQIAPGGGTCKPVPEG